MSAILAFDCAVSGMSIAVVRDHVCLSSLREEGRDQAARLLPAVAFALGNARVLRKTLDMIAVTIGPGSFTGVRVGLAAARGLALGLGIPLAAASTTAVLRAQAGDAGDRLVVAAIDSHLGDWFCETGDADAGPFVAGAEEVATHLGGRASLVVGHETAPLVAALQARGIDVRARNALPDPVVLARLAQADGVETWRRRNATEGLPRPLYLRGVNITTPDGTRRTVD